MKCVMPFKIGVIFILIVMCSGGAFASRRDEKRALEKIEEFFLREKYLAAERSCGKFLRDHRRSGSRARVKYLKDTAIKKILADYYENNPVSLRNKKKGPDSGDFYLVQVGAFEGLSNAKKLVRSLKKKGFDAAIVKIKRGRNNFYKVRAGKFRKRDNAQRLVRDLIREGHYAEIINE